MELLERMQSRRLQNSCFQGGCVWEYYYVVFLLFCALYFVFITTYYLEIPLEYLFFSLSLLLTVVFFRFTRCSGNMIQLSISLYIFNLVFSWKWYLDISFPFFILALSSFYLYHSREFKSKNKSSPAFYDEGWKMDRSFVDYLVTNNLFDSWNIRIFAKGWLWFFHFIVGIT